MSIPKDETAVVAGEFTNKKNQNKDTVNLFSDESQPPLTGDMAGGGGEYVSEQDKSSLTEPVQIASLGSTINTIVKKGGKAIDSGIELWNEIFMFAKLFV